MKKTLSIILAVLVVVCCVGFVGCSAYNKQIVDLNYHFDRAIIQLANGEVVECKVKSWSDYDGEQIQIVSEDGTVYLTSSFRCDLINDK